MEQVHANLKTQLGEWVAKCDEASSFPVGEDRLRTIESFCTSFVPEDVVEDEMKEYAKSLGDDDVSIPRSVYHTILYILHTPHVISSFLSHSNSYLHVCDIPIYLLNTGFLPISEARTRPMFYWTGRGFN
jgi:hypothetical protein